MIGEGVIWSTSGEAGTTRGERMTCACVRLLMRHLVMISCCILWCRMEWQKYGGDTVQDRKVVQLKQTSCLMFIF